MRIAEHRSAQCTFDRYADPKLTVPDKRSSAAMLGYIERELDFTGE